MTERKEKPEFRILVEKCGLTLRGVANFVHASENMVKSWSCGRDNRMKSHGRALRKLKKLNYIMHEGLDDFWEEPEEVVKPKKPKREKK